MTKEHEVCPFSCVEKDCEGLVDPLSENVTPLRGDEYSTTEAVSCPLCGRAYGKDAVPVLSIDYQKVFVRLGAIDERPLSAAEKYNLIRDSIEGMNGYNSFEVQGLHRRRIIGVCGGDDVFFARRSSRKGHAPDCEAVSERAFHMCNCGALYARDWFKDNDNLAGEL